MYVCIFTCVNIPNLRARTLPILSVNASSALKDSQSSSILHILYSSTTLGSIFIYILSLRLVNEGASIVNERLPLNPPFKHMYLYKHVD